MTIAASTSRGTVVGIQSDQIVFRPLNTNYELHLKTDDPSSFKVGPARLRVCARARKVYSVPSGGAFVAPILGTPRTIQGRVVDLSPTHIVVQAGALFEIELPMTNGSIDLANGAIEVGSMVNVIAWPGVKAVV